MTIASNLKAITSSLPKEVALVARHIPLELKVDEKATYINLGEWISQNSYAILKDGELNLKTYNN